MRLQNLVQTSRQASGRPAQRKRVAFTWVATLGVTLVAGCLGASRVQQREGRVVSVSPAAFVGYRTPFGPRGFDEMRTSRPQRAREPSRDQVAQYRASRQKTVIELQQFRETTSLTLEGLAGGPVVASLIDLSPQIGTWYVLRLEASNGRSSTYHLENPSGARLRLDPAYRFGIVIEREGMESSEGLLCELWPEGAATPLACRPRFPCCVCSALRRASLPAQPGGR